MLLCFDFFFRPVVFGALWQCFGAAISLPLYFANHLKWLHTNPGAEARVRNSNEAKALPSASS